MKIPISPIQKHTRRDQTLFLRDVTKKASGETDESDDKKTVAAAVAALGTDENESARVC